ncbi:type IV pilus biogenesis protein PilM [Pantoea sp. SIMBA_079]|uniref:type IV pilus biogenesis protein PilM n=1 Tax=Pantoea sp. SIMBA_079 TaxID=3085817 RepID=UPI0039962870
MKASIFFAAVLTTVAGILSSFINKSHNDNINQVIQAQQAGQFLNYVAAFNNLWAVSAPADGDAASKVSLPSWLTRNSSIQLRISSGTGYVFAPSSPGFYSQLMQKTENSAHFGLSDAAGINTPSGRLTRPGFIPAGYVVYVR